MVPVYWGRKQEYPVKTFDLWQVTRKHFHMRFHQGHPASETGVLSENLRPAAASHSQNVHSCKRLYQGRSHHGRDRMVVGFITTYAISTYYH